MAFHVVVMPVVLGASLAVATWAPTWWICRADKAVAAYSLAVQALTLLHLAATSAAGGQQQLHELLLVCALPFVCAIAFHLPWRRSCAVGGVVLGLQLLVTPLLGHDGWDAWLSRTGALLISNLLLFFAALYAEAARRTHFRQNLGLQRFQEGAETFDQFKLQHERLLKKVDGLRQAKDMAEEKSKAKTLFLANTCHELRTPLNGVIGMIGVLKNTALTQEQKEYVETVESSGEALLDLVNDILDFSKIESGKIVLEDIEFDLRAVVEEVGEMMSFRAHSKALELITYIPHDLPTRLVGDSTRLRQVLINLVSNGVKFTEKGQVAIHAGLISSTESHAVLRFEVRDTGIGISEKMVHQLFEPWTQANQSTFRKYGGSGLGLAISKQLVELFEGGIHIQSEEGKGSSFIFTAKFKRQAMRPASSRTIVTRDMIRQVRGTRCLVVESNGMCAASVKEVLLSLECSVRTVSSCREALRLLNAEAATKGEPPATAAGGGANVVSGSPPASAATAANSGGHDVIFIDSLRLAKEPKEMEAMMANHRDRYFVLMTRITERGVLRINASNFSSLAKPVKRIPLLDCLVAFKERAKEQRLNGGTTSKLKRTTTTGTHYNSAGVDTADTSAAAPRVKSEPSTPTLGHRRLSEEEAQEQGGGSGELDASAEVTPSPGLESSLALGRRTDCGVDEDGVDLYSDDGGGQASSPLSGSDGSKRKRECEGPISVARILHSIQSQTETLSPDHSLREIDGASFLMAEGNRRLSIGARILLVEDNITNQKVAVRMLTRLGHRCDIAENGLQAVHAVCNNDYLLVLMDMRLPGMDGITATQEIRKAEREGGTSSERPCTIVAMTADASPEFRHKALQSGMQDVVTKPVKFDVLKEVLEKYLPRENRSSSTPSLPTSLASSTSGGALVGSSDGVPPPSSPSPRVAPKS